MATKRYSSHNPRNAGQILPDFAPTHESLHSLVPSGVVRFQHDWHLSACIHIYIYIYTYIIYIYTQTHIYMIYIHTCVCIHMSIVHMCMQYSTHRILAEGSCRILIEVLPPSSDLWSQPCWRHSYEEARGRKKKHPRGWRRWKSLRRRAPIANLINGQIHEPRYLYGFKRACMAST